MKSLPVLLMAALLPNAAAAETIDVRSDSEQPTVIYGEAENANGTFNEMTVSRRRMPKIRSATRSSMSFLTVSRRLRLKRASRCRRRPNSEKVP